MVPDFFDGVKVRDQPRAQVASLADIAAVHKKGIRGLALAVDGNVAGVQHAGHLAVSADGVGRFGIDARLQAQQIDVAAAVQM